MNIYEIVAVALICGVVVLAVRQLKPEFAVLVAIAAGCFVLLQVLSQFAPLINGLKSIAEASGIKSEYLTVMLKSLGICYITQFSSELCNDFGQTSLGSKIELCGRIALAAISLPLMISLINTITKMVG